MSDIDEIFEENKREMSKGITAGDKKVADYFLDEVNTFYKNGIKQSKADVRKWQKIALASGMISSLSAIALIVAMPLKTIETELVTVHDKTGNVSITRLSDANEMTYGEAVDKSNIANFIILRNGYDWQTIQNSFDTMKTESSKNIFEQYTRYIQAKNSPVNVFEDGYKIDIKIDGEPIFLPTKDGNDQLAQVLFTRKIRKSNGDYESGFPDKSYTATITYNYKKSELSAKERLVNPLGFQVTSYREDKKL